MRTIIISADTLLTYSANISGLASWWVSDTVGRVSRLPDRHSQVVSTGMSAGDRDSGHGFTRNPETTKHYSISLFIPGHKHITLRSTVSGAGVIIMIDVCVPE